MQISEEMQSLISQQINAELYSAYLYDNISNYFEGASLFGLAKWVKKHASEERAHAQKLTTYVLDRVGKVTLLPIEAPPPEIPSPLAAFDMIYSHEQKVTILLKDLQKKARLMDDILTDLFLNWFLLEQIEEEATAYTMRDKMKMVGGNSAALFILDKESGV